MKREPEVNLEKNNGWEINGSSEMRSDDEENHDQGERESEGSLGKGKERKRRRSSIGITTPISLEGPDEPPCSPRSASPAEKRALLRYPHAHRLSSAAVTSLERQAQIQATTMKLAETNIQHERKFKLGSGSRSLSRVARQTKRAAERSSLRGKEASLPPELRMTRTQPQAKKAPRKDSSRNENTEWEGVCEDDVSESYGTSTQERREQLLGLMSITGSEGCGRQRADAREYSQQSPDLKHVVTRTPTVTNGRSTADANQQSHLDGNTHQQQSGPAAPSVTPRPSGRIGHRRSNAVDLQNTQGTISQQPASGTVLVVLPLQLPPDAHHEQSTLHGRKHKENNGVDLSHSRQTTSQEGADGEKLRGGDNNERA